MWNNSEICSAMTSVRILMPGMCRELAAGIPAPPALRALLRFAHRETIFDGNDLAWRSKMFGVERQQDWPVAPFAALAEGLPVGRAYWLCADPVHLRLLRDSFALERADVASHHAHSGAMVDALNTHFSSEGMTFFATPTGRWYLRLDSPPQLMTTPLSQVVGRDIHPMFPQGGDALRWHARLNEIQMLLHGCSFDEHPDQHENSPVNSVWLWGGGVLPECAPGQHPAVWANDAFTRGLAMAHGSSVTSLPVSADAWLKVDRSGDSHLIVLEPMQQVNQHDIALDWASALERLDSRWFLPLLHALRTGAIRRLELHLAGMHVVQRYTLTRLSLHRFWRRAQPLGAYLG